MLGIFSFLDFRKANGCEARYTPLKALLVHPSPLPLSYSEETNLLSHFWLLETLLKNQPWASR